MHQMIDWKAHQDASITESEVAVRANLETRPWLTRHRQCAGHKDLGMEVFDIKLAAERLFGLVTQPQDGQLPDLIRQGLAGPDDVTLNLVLGICFAH
jgi:hypothetical protein